MLRTGVRSDGRVSKRQRVTDAVIDRVTTLETQVSGDVEFDLTTLQTQVIALSSKNAEQDIKLDSLQSDVSQVDQDVISNDGDILTLESSIQTTKQDLETALAATQLALEEADTALNERINAAMEGTGSVKDAYLAADDALESSIQTTKQDLETALASEAQKLDDLQNAWVSSNIATNNRLNVLETAKLYFHMQSSPVARGYNDTQVGGNFLWDTRIDEDVVFEDLCSFSGFQLTNFKPTPVKLFLTFTCSAYLGDKDIVDVFMTRVNFQFQENTPLTRSKGVIVYLEEKVEKPRSFTTSWMIDSLYYDVFTVYVKVPSDAINGANTFFLTSGTWSVYEV